MVLILPNLFKWIYEMAISVKRLSDDVFEVTVSETSITATRCQ